MTLPPLANLFAVHDSDPVALEALAVHLVTGGDFQSVWHPAPGWVAAAAPLPGGPRGRRGERETGLAFAEGRDAVGPPLASVARLADVCPQRLASLRGDFGFVRFRPDGAATVVRSAGGLVPFYLSRPASRVAIGTRLGDFGRYLPDEPRIDPLVNAVWTTGQGFFPDGRTFLTGVSILERGAFAQVEPGRAITTERYWNPRPTSLERPTPARTREHAERLRALLVRTLERDLDPAGGNLLTLSGGVDSSALAALAAGVVGRPVWTWSLLPAPEDWFQHEMSYIAPLAARYGFARRWVVRMEKQTRLELQRAAPRVVFHVVHPALCDLPRVAREAPVRVLFGGEFADEVCGSAFTLPDWAVHTSLVQLTGLRSMLRWARRRAASALGRPALPFPRDLPDLVREDVRDEYRTWRERRERDAARDDDPLRYLALRAELDGFVAMNWEAASALRVRRSFPFFNREALELAFACHPSELVGRGTKQLLRAALRADVPSRNLERPDKGHGESYLRGTEVAWIDALPSELDDVIAPECHPDPHSLLGHREAAALLQLVRFVGSLNATRSARRPHAGARAVAATEEV